MFCPKCGKENPDGSTFCSGCGESLTAATAAAVAAAAAETVQAAQAVKAAQPAPQAAPIPQAAPAAAPRQSRILPFGEFFKVLINASIKPVTGPAEEAKKFDAIGNSMILAGIVVAILTAVTFFTRIITATINNSWKYWDDAGEAAGHVVKFFFSPLFENAVFIFAVAGAFMLAGLILHEKWSFSRLVALATMALVPRELIQLLLVTYIDYLGKVPGIKYIHLGSLISTAASFYFFVMLYEGITKDTKLEGNKKGFVFVIAVAVATVVSNYFYWY